MLAERGVDARFDAVRLCLPDGVRIVAARTQQRRPGAGLFRATAPDVRLTIRWRALLLRRQVRVESIRWSGGKIEWWPSGDPAGPVVTVDHWSGQVDAEAGGWQRIESRGAAAGLDLHVVGRAPMPSARVRAVSPSPPSPLRPAAIAAVLWPPPEWLRANFAGGGRLEVAFEAEAGHWPEVRAEIRGEGGAVELAGVDWDRWAFEAEIADGSVRVRAAELEGGGSRLRLRGSAPLTSGGAPEGSLSAVLAPARLASLPLPDVARRFATSMAVRMEQPLRVNVAALPSAAGGPASWKVEVAADHCDIAGVWIERLRAAGRIDGARVRVHQLLAVVGREAMSGPASLEGEVDLASREFRLRGEMGFDPMALAGWMTPMQILHAGAARFLDDSPTIRCRAAGRIGDPLSWSVDGTFSARRFTWNGAYLDDASADVTVRGGVLRLDNVRLGRGDGWLAGRMAQDLPRRTVEVDAESTIPIPVLARLAGPAAHRFVSQFWFGGPTRVLARGRVDYGRREIHDGALELEGGPMGMAWFRADRVALCALAQGREVELTSCSGVAMGGGFGGRARFSLPAGPEERTAYVASAAVTNLNLTDVLRALTDRNEQAQAGRLFGSIELSGRIGKGEGATAVGVGRIRIRRGHLLEIPLFGGLSSHLSAIVPGLGFASQGDFRAEFRIRNGAVETDLAELRGDLLSLEGRGRYFFDRRMDFQVEAKLLRGGGLADALRLLTLPITRLLVFDLRGSLAQPEWLPRNLPF